MLWYISNGISCIMQVLFLVLNLKPKKNSFLTFLIMAVPFTTLALIQKTMPYELWTVLIFVTWAYYVGMTLLLFKDSLKVKAITMIACISICYACALLFTGLNSLVLGDTQGAIFSHIPYNILSIFCMGIYTLMKNNIVENKNSLIMFSVITGVQMLFAWVATVFLNYESAFSEMDFWGKTLLTAEKLPIVVCIVCAALCIVSDIVMFISISKMQKSEKEKEELRFREYKNQLNFDYYKSVEKNAEETRKLRHDMANIIQIAGSMIESDPESRETSSQIISQMKKEISEINLKRYTENTLINAIIANKAAECKENGIECDFDINIYGEIGVEEIDICKAYVNIIDNAINAVMMLDSDKKRIEIKSKTDNGKLYISSKNTFSETENKKDKNHGYGQKILSDTAEKYNGKFITEKKDGIYTSLIVMDA